MSGKRPIILEAGENRLLEPDEKIVGHVTEQEMAQALASKLDASALSSNLTYYMTQAATDVSGYMRLVRDTHDSDFPATVQVVESPNIGANEINIGNFITDSGTRAHHFDNLTLTVSGQARKVDAGTANIALRFEVWVRRVDNSEYLIGASGSVPVTIAQFTDLHATAIIPHVEFMLGDRLVLKYFASKFGTGFNPKVRYRLGGEDPMRALLPLPITAMLPDFGDAAYKNTGTTSNTVAAGDDSRFSDIAGKVNKTGDSMQGNLIFQVPNNASTGFQFSSEKNPYGFSVEVFTDAAGNMTNAYIGYADSGISINPSGNVWIGGSVGAGGGFSGTVPNTRKVNNKQLNADITLSAGDVGAEPAFTKNTAFNKDFGTTAGTVAAGDHAHSIANVTNLQAQLDSKLPADDASVTNAREWTAAAVSQAEAESGTATTARKWTAQRVRQAIAAWWAGVVGTVVQQSDVGTGAGQIPLNQYLGGMAYQNPESVVIQPAASATPHQVGAMVFELTSNTALVIKVKGSDGTVRSVTLTLA